MSLETMVEGGNMVREASNNATSLREEGRTKRYNILLRILDLPAHILERAGLVVINVYHGLRYAPSYEPVDSHIEKELRKTYGGKM